MSQNQTNKKLVSFIIALFLISLLGLVYTQICLKQNDNNRMLTTISNQKLFLATTTDKLDKKLGLMADKLDTYAMLLSTGKISMPEFESELSNEKLWLNYGIVGVGIAEVPKLRSNGRKHFHRNYWLNLTTRFESQQDSNNYTLNTQENAWFNDTLKNQKPQWSRSYYDNSLREFIFSYSAPVYDVTHKNIIAVLVVDFDSQFIDSIVSQNIGQKYTSIISRDDGAYIYTDNTDKVLNQVSLSKITNKNSIEAQTYQYINKNHCNQVCSLALSDNSEKHLILYQSLKKLPWTIFADYTTQQLGSLNRESDNSLTMLNIGFWVISLLLLVVLVNLYRMSKKRTFKTLWQLSALVSLILVCGIVYVWKISNHLYYRDTSKAIINQTILDSYIKQYDAASQLKRTESIIKIPTAIIIDSAEFLNSYNIQLSGHIMQRYPKNSEDAWGVKFNDGFDAKITQTGVQKTNRYDHVTWSFQVKIRENFDYTHYPFNHGSIWLAVSPVNQYKNLLFTPDFSYYNGLTDINAANGVARNLIIPGWYIRGSYFNYQNDSSRMVNNVNSYSAIDLPALTFNILIGATFGDAVITTVIPPMVIIMILFVTMLTISKKGNKSIEFKVNSILSASSGMLFTIVFTHVSLRNKITSAIMYIEYFYLMMYIVVPLIPINAFLFATKKFPKINFASNLYAKLLFFPVISFLLFIISLWRFA
ncbi:cache domain-containing protein [Aquella oligotrophica]|uniref:Uncharacterized protein n=1 Tax=Aquella oligotrophica TaxID=2067065 RepID=A0A2I7N772_9NEIS|nr:cache domain-containing protein [Aquella oligotrophica]AUR52308.1 hypothetical protein CUN60_08370 [Aquella oligotrophica]